MSEEETKEIQKRRRRRFRRGDEGDVRRGDEGDSEEERWRCQKRR